MDILLAFLVDVSPISTCLTAHLGLYKICHALDDNMADVQRSAPGQYRYIAIRYCLLNHHLRQVGVCLKHLPAFSRNTDHFFHSNNIPWQRVVNSKGIISPRYVLFQLGDYFAISLT